MRTFHDAEKREWTCSITIGAVARVKDLAGVDLFDLTGGDPPVGVRITTEPLLFADVLYAVCQPQCESKSLGKPQFLEGLSGDATAAAFTAFVEDLADFFRQSGHPELARAVEKQTEVLAKAHQLATARIETFDVDRELEKIVNQSLSGNESTSSPGYSASTPPA